MTTTPTNNKLGGKAAAIISAALLLPAIGAKADCVPPADAQYGDACVDASNPSVKCTTTTQSKSGKSTKNGKSKTAKIGKGAVALYYNDGPPGSNCVTVQNLELDQCEKVALKQGCVVESDTEGCKSVEMCVVRHDALKHCSDCPNARIFQILGDPSYKHNDNSQDSRDSSTHSKV